MIWNILAILIVAGCFGLWWWLSGSYDLDLSMKRTHEDPDEDNDTT